MYKRVDEQTLKELRAIVGKDGVLVGEDELQPYAHDETPELNFPPEAAVRPQNRDEVKEIVKLAKRRRIPITPRGGGTGLSGGAVPVFGGIVISFERMNRTKEIDEANLMVVTEPGVVTGDLGEAVESCGLFYPPDPVSLDSCTLGGNIAECAGGPRAVKYGVTRDYVQGLEVVFPDGEIGKLGGKLLKDVTGYSLLDIVIGSEGTLAIVTEATLRLLPLPSQKVDLVIPFNDTSAMVRGIVPSTVELMEGKGLKATERFLKRDIPFSDADAQILVELDGNRSDELARLYEMVGEIALEKGALDVLVAEDKSAQEKVWEPRKNIGDALKETGNLIIRDDLVVPPSLIPALLEELKIIEEKYEVEIYCFGHMGDGNIHVDIVAGGSFREFEDHHAREKLIGDLYRVTLQLGGSITAEHGIGYVKKSWLHLGASQSQIELMKKIKLAFDPENILNPGKIFDL
ncbi:hypothetical protein AMJ40_02290 [candidate division TA06 bacterium DG_26]|uniref:FAD-binding PCMH-type domain-containing protein n=1 Tax=candidate division TA06 bacterium DG_26 TaxID=1703771 RepID=A0A0S7WKC7_UNCT6|nr:MAG: hypothetical protein AMJ40_02290 [candidate division TA06 bacterium DG_26]